MIQGYQVQTEATKSLQEISAKYQYVSGKWLIHSILTNRDELTRNVDRLIFAPSDKIDMIWSNLASQFSLWVRERVSHIRYSISRVRAACFNARVSRKGFNIARTGYLELSTYHLFIHA